MRKSKEKILICIDWFLPGYKAGGPIRSVTNLVTALQYDYEIYVLTSAYDLGEEEPYEDVILNEWVAREEYFVKYLDQNHQKKGVIKTNIEMLAPDYIYLNSLFSKVFTLYPIAAVRRHKNIKTILAPRGMLGEGALKIKSRKKNIFLKATRWTKLFKNVTWHATSQEEKQEINKNFPNATVAEVIPNLPRKVDVNIKKVIDKKQHFETVKICFVSRLSKKKNLEYALKILNDISFEKKVQFNIYGVFEEEEYEKEVKAVEVNQAFLEVNYKGFSHPDDVPEIFKTHHLHFLPTQHENYGHSIVESWAYGCPVLISDNTPWKNLEQECVGWDIPLDQPEKFKEAIQKLMDMDIVTYNKWVASCFQFYRSFVYKKSDFKKYKSHLFVKDE